MGISLPHLHTGDAIQWREVATVPENPEKAGRIHTVGI